MHLNKNESSSKPKWNHNKRRRTMLGVPFALSALAAGCVATIPPDAFTVSDEMLGERQLQSRRFNGVTEQETLIASSNVLQDMGFNLENSEVSLGVLTANKQRDATSAGEIVGAVILALLFGVAKPVSKSQSIRVSLVIQPAGSDSVIAPSYAGSSSASPVKAMQAAIGKLPESQQKATVEAMQKPGNYVVRVTFQRIVTRTDNSVYVETLKDADIYQDFFEKLSKSVFIEAQQV
jgi:hypothetical protein